MILKTIKVIDFCKFAISEEKGLKLRELLLKNLSEDKIVLDFEGISMFTTPFFNSSIGYFILQYGPELFDEKIEILGLQEMGQETYKHSYDNAVEFYNNKIDPKTVGQIVSKNLES